MVDCRGLHVADDARTPQQRPSTTPTRARTDSGERLTIVTCFAHDHQTAYLVRRTGETHGTALELGDWEVQTESGESYDIAGTTPHRIAIRHTTGGLDSPPISELTFFDPATNKFTAQVVIGNTLEVTGGTVVRCRYSGVVDQTKTCAEQAGTIDIIPIE